MKLSWGFYRWEHVLPGSELYDTLLHVSISWEEACLSFGLLSIEGVVVFTVAMKYHHQTAMKAGVEIIDDEESAGSRA